MSDAQRRALRTLLQALTGAGIIGFIELFVLPFFPDHPTLTPEQRTMAIAIAGGIVSLVHNYLEDNTAMPAVWKAIPSAGVNPVDVGPKT